MSGVCGILVEEEPAPEYHYCVGGLKRRRVGPRSLPSYHCATAATVCTICASGGGRCCCHHQEGPVGESDVSAASLRLLARAQTLMLAGGVINQNQQNNDGMTMTASRPKSRAAFSLDEIDGVRCDARRAIDVSSLLWFPETKCGTDPATNTAVKQCPDLRPQLQCCAAAAVSLGETYGAGCDAIQVTHAETDSLLFSSSASKNGTELGTLPHEWHGFAGGDSGRMN